MGKHAGETVPSERLSEIVNHLNQGLSLIESVDERLRLAERNLRVGQRAKNSSAYKVSLDYLLIAEQLLPINAWDE